MQKRAVVVSYPAQRHLHEAAIYEMARDQRPGDTVRAINMYPDRFAPRGAPVILDLLPLDDGVQAIRFCFASRQLAGKNLDGAAICGNFRGRHTVHRRDGEHDNRQ